MRQRGIGRLPGELFLDPDFLGRRERLGIALDGSDGAGRAIVSGPDFVAAPRPSPDGSLLAWLEWDLPGMPWDSTRLRVAEVLADGSLGAARTVAGRPGISIVQPAWRADGVLHYVSDETGWWNLFALDGPDRLDDPPRNLAPMEAELGDPAWVFGRSSYAFTDDGGVLAVQRADGRDALLRISPACEVGASMRPLPDSRRSKASRSRPARPSSSDSGPHDGAIVARLDPRSARLTGVLARSLSTPLDPGLLPHAEPVAFPTSGGATARALYFPPTNDGFRGPDGALPPLLVLSHGGPTSAASSALSLDRALFTSRGIAVVDVDYRGSTGYGRPYRDALNGQWGIVAEAVALLALIAGQDVEPVEGSDGTDGRWRIAQRVAPDRVISTVDPDARHAHKTVHRRQDGFKAHIAVEPDTGIITDCALTKASGADTSDAAVGLDLLAGEPRRCGCSAIRPTAPGSPRRTRRRRSHRSGQTRTVRRRCRAGSPSTTSPSTTPPDRDLPAGVTRRSRRGRDATFAWPAAAARCAPGAPPAPRRRL